MRKNFNNYKNIVVKIIIFTSVQKLYGFDF